MCSLHRITVFIEQYPLENKTTADISPITDFGFVAWEFISFIYKSGQNKLIANNKNKYFY